MYFLHPFNCYGSSESIHEKGDTVENEILTIEEVALFLRVSERTVYDWAQKGKIPCGRLGSSWRFKRSEILKWIEQKLGTPNKTLSQESVTLDQVLSEERCVLLNSKTKEGAFDTLITLLAHTPEVESETELREAIFSRESLMSTGIGLGIGIPHARIPSVASIVMALGVCRTPLKDYTSIDDTPVNVIAMVAAGKEQHSKYIKLLAVLCSRLKEEKVRDNLKDASDPSELYNILVY